MIFVFVILFVFVFAQTNLPPVKLSQYATLRTLLDDAGCSFANPGGTCPMFLRTLDANYLCSRDKTATTYPIITCDDSGNLIFFDINGYEYVFEEKIRCFVEIFLLLER